MHWGPVQGPSFIPIRSYSKPDKPSSHPRMASLALWSPITTSESSQMDGTDSSDGSTPDVHPKEERERDVLTPKPSINWRQPYVLQNSIIRNAESYGQIQQFERARISIGKERYPIPQTKTQGTNEFFFFFLFFLRLEVNPLRHMVSELV